MIIKLLSIFIIVGLAVCVLIKNKKNTIITILLLTLVVVFFFKNQKVPKTLINDVKKTIENLTVFKSLIKSFKKLLSYIVVQKIFFKKYSVAFFNNDNSFLKIVKAQFSKKTFYSQWFIFSQKLQQAIFKIFRSSPSELIKA